MQTLIEAWPVIAAVLLILAIFGGWLSFEIRRAYDEGQTDGYQDGYQAACQEHAGEIPREW